MVHVYKHHISVFIKKHGFNNNSETFTAVFLW